MITESDFSLAKEWRGSISLNNDLITIDDTMEVPVPTSPRRLSFIVIALCTSGSAHYTIDTMEQTLTAGNLLVITSRRVLSQFQSTPDFRGLGLFVSEHFFHETIRNVNEVSTLFLFTRDHPVLKLSESEQLVFRGYFATIRHRLSDINNHFRYDLTRTLLMAMFYDLSDVIYRASNMAVKNSTRADDIFTKFILLVEHNCHQERRVSWYAKQLCITSKYLSETIKQVSRRTPNEWIDRYVTLALRSMLKNTTKSIKEIAEELNFPNQSFLGKYFKEHVGMSPSKYRKS